jgi:Fimbrial assembly protein (PilN)
VTFEFLTKYPFIYQRLLNRLGYYSNGVYAISENNLTPDNSGKQSIIVVAKAHYSEAWQSFSSINKSELNKLLALKKKSNVNQQSIFQVIDNKSIDGFDVKTISFEPEIFKTLGLTKILIPETELLHTETNQVIEVDTPKGILFSSVVGNKINSAYAQGIMANLSTYKLSAGLPSNATVFQIIQDEFPAFILERLLQTNVVALGAKSLANPRSWVNTTQLHWLYGAPLITALAFYGITNSYLAVQTYLVESSLSDGGQQVSAILKQKQAIDIKSQLLAQLSEEFSAQSLAHHNWQIIAMLLDEGATLTRITYKEGQLTVRGNAEKASSVLAAIAKSTIVESASFNGPVRSSRGADAFVMQIVPKERV